MEAAAAAKRAEEAAAERAAAEQARKLAAEKAAKQAAEDEARRKRHEQIRLDQEKIAREWVRRDAEERAASSRDLAVTTSLIRASAAGDAAAVQRLLASDSLDPIADAQQHGNDTDVEAANAVEANPHFHPLAMSMHAAIRGGHTDVVNALANHGSNGLLVRRSVSLCVAVVIAVVVIIAMIALGGGYSLTRSHEHE